MQALSKVELKELKEYLEIGDPLKDRYDEIDLIYRLVATVNKLNRELKAAKAYPKD